MRSNSFLDADSKLTDIYLRTNKKIDYGLLTKLNLKLKNENLKLKRLFSFKQEYIKQAVFFQDVVNNIRLYKEGYPLSIKNRNSMYQKFYEKWYI